MSRPPGARDGTRYGDDGGSRSVRPAWIEVIAEEAAEGELAELYDGLRSPQTGRVDHVMAIHSLHPQTMRDHAQLYRTLMDGKGGLSRPRAREDRRRRLGRQPLPLLTASPRGRSWPPHRTDEARPRRRPRRRLPLRAPQRAELAICEHAVKLTLQPWEMEREDLDPMRAAGSRIETSSTST